MRGVLDVDCQVKQGVLVLVAVVATKLQFLLVGEVESDIRLRLTLITTVGSGECHGTRLAVFRGREFMYIRVADF